MSGIIRDSKSTYYEDKADTSCWAIEVRLTRSRQRMRQLSGELAMSWVDFLGT
jgi:hypothetical protein